MIVRRLAARGLARAGSTEEDPRRRSTYRYLLVVFSAGAISGVAALIGLGPFSDLHTLIDNWVYAAPGPNQIQASSLYPSPKPVHKTVNVYDPAERSDEAVPATPAAPAQSQTPPRPAASPLPSPTDE